MPLLLRLCLLACLLPGAVFAQLKAPTAEELRSRFQKAYAKTVSDALATSDQSGDFWLQAEELVLGKRQAPADAAEAQQVIKALEANPSLLYPIVSAKDPKEYYLGDPAQEAKLQQALDAYCAHNSEENFQKVSIVLQPFLNTLEAAEAGPGGVLIPAKSAILYETTPFCLQHNLGAPGSNDPMWLVSADALIPEGARDIYQALLVYSVVKPKASGLVQSLLWAIRESNQRPLLDPTPEQVKVLNEALENGADKFHQFMLGSRKDATPAPGATPSQPTLLNPDVLKRQIMLRNFKNAGIDHGKDPTNPANTQAILQAIQAAARQPAPLAQGNPAQSTDGFCRVPGTELVARTETTGLSETRIFVYNPASEAKVFIPSKYVGLTRANRQPAALPGPRGPQQDAIDAVKEKARLTKDATLAKLLEQADPDYKPRNPIDGTFLHNHAGDILALSLGLGRASHSSSTASYPIEAVVDYRQLVTTTGDKIDATRFVTGNPRMKFDCHGFTLTDGAYWINDGATNPPTGMTVYMGTVGATFRQVDATTARPGDLVVYYTPDGTTIIHSALYQGANTVKMAAGVATFGTTGELPCTKQYENSSKTTIGPIDQGWGGPHSMKIFHPGNN